MALRNSALGGRADHAEPERSGGEAFEILRRCAPQNDMGVGFPQIPYLPQWEGE